MKHGSYTEIKTMGNFVIGYNKNGIQPYVTWYKTDLDVIHAVFHSSYEEALEYLAWIKSHGEEEN